jgi:hypothetical protein
MTRRCRHLLWIFCLAISSARGRAAVELYQFPADAPAAKDFAVQVNGRPVFVYDTKVAAVASFGLRDEVEIRVKPRTGFREVVIRPLSQRIHPAITNGEIIFTITAPVQLSVELDGDLEHPLFIFANPPEQRPENLTAANLKYFAPGKIYRTNQIRLTNNQTLYLAGGAVVQGFLRASNAVNVKVLGPGILDGSYRRTNKTTMVQFTHCREVELREVAIFDSFGWTVHLNGCSNVLVDGIKQIGWRANSDGVDIDASRDVRVDNSFLRNADDCIAIKNTGQNNGQDSVNGVTVRRTSFWNTAGNAMEIGFELQGRAVSNVRFEDCDILHNLSGAAFSIHNGDTALVENVRYDNIRLEDARGWFTDLYIGLSIYSADCASSFTNYFRGNSNRQPVPSSLRDTARGKQGGQWILPSDKDRFSIMRGGIRDVVFHRIQFSGEELPPSLFIGFDAAHKIENVSLSEISVGGKPLPDWPRENVKLRHAENVHFEK